MLPKYTVIEVVAVGVFVCFCTGVLSILSGIMLTLASLFTLGSSLEVTGVSLIFFGLAITFVSAGIGCFLQPEDRMLIL